MLQSQGVQGVASHFFSRPCENYFDYANRGDRPRKSQKTPLRTLRLFLRTYILLVATATRMLQLQQECCNCNKNNSSNSMPSQCGEVFFQFTAAYFTHLNQCVSKSEPGNKVCIRTITTQRKLIHNKVSFTKIN